MGLRDGQALILAVKGFGERDALVEVLCGERGKIKGLVKGGKGTRGGIGAVLQPFNNVGYEHFRRLDGQLGTLTVELVKSRAHVWMGNGAGSFVVPYLSELLAGLLPEEHPYDGLHGRVGKVLDGMVTWQELVAFELYLLDLVGYGLRLRPEEGVCGTVGGESAAGAVAIDWAYVSPASGRVVDKTAAVGYESRLLPLPFCLGGAECSETDDFAMAWRLTGFFIEKALHGGALASRARLGNYYARQILETNKKDETHALAA